MANILLILSGCGVFDGAEIHEAVITLLHLDRHHANVTTAAPDIDQMHVIDHNTARPTDETRNVRTESARIARGPVEDLAAVNGADFDAVVLPGGFGAAKNLCNFATAGPDCEVQADVARVLRQAHDAGKTIGLCCIAPAIGARLFPGATLTIGADPDTAAALQTMGANHQQHPPHEACVDLEHRIVTTPAYMSADRISQVYDGIGALVDQVIALAQQPNATAK